MNVVHRKITTGSSCDELAQRKINERENNMVTDILCKRTWDLMGYDLHMQYAIKLATARWKLLDKILILLCGMYLMVYSFEVICYIRMDFELNTITNQH